MRISVRSGWIAVLGLALIAPLASIGAQGRNRGQQGSRVATPRSPADGRARGGARGDTRGARDNGAQIQVWARPEVIVSGPGDSRTGSRPREGDRGPRDDRARRDDPRRGNDGWRGDDRWRGDDGWRGDDRWRGAYPWGGADRWRGDAHWRDSHVRIVLQFFANQRHARSIPYRAWLPYGWERRIVLNAIFPLAYDPYCEPVPYELDYLLPPLYRGHHRFLFGDRLIIIDRITRHILLVIRL